MRKLAIILPLLLMSLVSRAQYSPQAGVAGSTAIPASSSLFIQWATWCNMQRGRVCIDTPSLGQVTNGDSSLALGEPDHSVVSLGDSGIATLTFSGLVYNGPGPDFAVFENGFINPANDSQAFLELAFVEVSSDGEHFFRFPARSLTPINTQIRGSGDYMYANLINNLAGKYGAGYGTPFDLQELNGVAGLDVNKVTHIRLVDVIGSIGTHSCTDSAGYVINDPYPTNYPTGGFDLDAVGLIHFTSTTSIETTGLERMYLSPNPCAGILQIRGLNRGECSILNSLGNIVFSATVGENVSSFDIHQLPVGFYYVTLVDENGKVWRERLVKF